MIKALRVLGEQMGKPIFDWMKMMSVIIEYIDGSSI